MSNDTKLKIFLDKDKKGLSEYTERGAIYVKPVDSSTAEMYICSPTDSTTVYKITPGEEAETETYIKDISTDSSYIDININDGEASINLNLYNSASTDSSGLVISDDLTNIFNNVKINNQPLNYNGSITAMAAQPISGNSLTIEPFESVYLTNNTGAVSITITINNDNTCQISNLYVELTQNQTITFSNSSSKTFIWADGIQPTNLLTGFYNFSFVYPGYGDNIYGVFAKFEQLN